VIFVIILANPINNKLTTISKMSNEDQYEYYGWKADQLGFFTEWRESVALAISKDPKAERSSVGSYCYELLKKKQQESLRPQLAQAS
jgi:hypothetical protein